MVMNVTWGRMKRPKPWVPKMFICFVDSDLVPIKWPWLRSNTNGITLKMQDGHNHETNLCNLDLPLGHMVQSDNTGLYPFPHFSPSFSYGYQALSQTKVWGVPLAHTYEPEDLSRETTKCVTRDHSITQNDVGSKHTETLVHDENFRVSLAMTVSQKSVYLVFAGLLLLQWIGFRGRIHVLCNATTLKMNPRESTKTTTGSTLSPGDSSVYSPNR